MRASTTIVLAAVLGVVLMLAVTHAAPTVMGIDLGSEFVKICAAKKDNTIDIVLNEQTRRKSNHYLGFRGEDRYFGEDARNLAARFPTNMFAMLNRIIGLGYDVPEDQAQLDFFLKEMEFPFIVGNESKRGSLTMSVPQNPKVTYTIEELMGMFFTYLKEMTIKDTEAPPKNDADAVITVPAFWNMRQRQALVDAANLAGIRVLAQMHPTTATALQFGMQQQGFGNETKHVIIYDMGSTKTEVGVFTFTETPIPEGETRVKLAHSLGTLTTRYIASDPTLGGRTFDLCIAKELQRQFAEKFPKLPVPLGGKTVNQYKSAFSLFRAANNIKEMLSANSASPITVEGIAPDKDFTTKFSREEFETICAPLFERSIKIVKEAVEKSGVPLEDITRFELMGGGSRLPKLVDDLSAFYGKPVDRTLNTDESAAFGTAYYAARLSGFRVRSFKVRDQFPHNIDFVLSPKGRDPKADPESKKPAAKPPVARDLFVHTFAGAKRSITVNRTDDFTIYLRANGKPHAEIEITGIRNALEVLDFFNPTIPHENNSHAVRVELKLGDNGVISTVEAEVKFRYAANVSKRIRVPVNDTNSTADANNNSTSESTEEGSTNENKEDKDKESNNQEAKDSEEEGKKDGDSEESEGSSSGDNSTETGSNSTAKKVKKTWITVSRIEMKRKTRPLGHTIRYTTRPLPMDAEDVAAGKAILVGLEAQDELKRQTSAAKNDLETYLHHVKGDGILENNEIVELKMITDEQRKAIEETATEVQEWVEDGEGSYEDCKKEQFEEQLRKLKAATEPVETPYRAHIDHIMEIQRNETIAKKKAAEEAAKAARKAKYQKKAEEKKADGTEKTEEEQKQEQEQQEQQEQQDQQDQEQKKEGDEDNKDEAKKEDL